MEISPSGQKSSSGFMTLGAGGYYTYPVAPGVSLFANGYGEYKFHGKDEVKPIEIGNYTAAGGVSVIRDENVYRVSLNYGVVTLGSEKFRSSAGIAGEWQYQFDERQAVSLGAQFAALRYSDVNNATGSDQRDADFYGLSAGYRRIFSHALQPILSVGLSYGDQQSRMGRRDLVSRVAGVNIGLSFTPAAQWGVALGYGHLKSDYKDRDIFIGETRHDRYDTAHATLSYLISRNVSIRGEVQRSKNRSNIAIYSFPRDLYAVKLRYEFK